MKIAEDIIEVVELKVTGPSQLHVRFNNDEEKEVDLSDLVLSPPPVFAPLQNAKEFERVGINVVGGVSWDCGADLSARYLREA